MAAHLIRRVAVVLFTMLVVWPSPGAEAQEPVLVSPDGRGPGSVRTIQEGIDAALPGGRVLVLPGTYEEKLVIDKELTLQGAGGTSGQVVILSPAPSPPPQPQDEYTILVDARPEATKRIEPFRPVTIRNLTIRHRVSNGIRGFGPVDVTVERVAVTADELPLGVGRSIGVTNDSTVTHAPRARLTVRDSFIDAGITAEKATRPPFAQVFGITVAGDVDALLERNVLRRTGGACIAIFLRGDGAGETNADVLGNDLDECYPLARAAAVFTGPAGAGLPSSVTATGRVNLVGNTIANSVPPGADAVRGNTGPCLPASAILFETFPGGRIEHNRIVGFVQECALPSARGAPAAIAAGSVRGLHASDPARHLFPPVRPVVRFNDLAGNAHAGLRVAPTETSALDATCNWWGSADGPGGDGPGDGDAVVVEAVGQVTAEMPDVEPWAARAIAGRGAPSCERRAE